MMACTADGALDPWSCLSISEHMEVLKIYGYQKKLINALWKNVLSKGRNSHGCKAIKCKIPCIDCKAVKL